MQLKQLLDDDDAVSPVIGVILMVAITVILAAVIATFVLGLGEQVSDTAPTASMSTDFSSDGGPSDQGELTVTHNGGDTILASEVFVRGNPGDETQHDLLTGNNYNDKWADIIASSDFTDVSAIEDDPASNVGSVSNNDNVVDGSASASIDGEDAIAAGDYLSIPAYSDGELRMVYDAQQGQQTATLTTWSGPDA